MPKKQTLEEFIKKSNIAHNFKYNYDKSIYINKQTKVIVICPEHGDFEVTPGAHYILKSGCPECAKISRSKTKSKGLEKFIKQANLKWNSFYNYSKVNYINNYTKVEIICPIHGSFFKDPRSHIDPQRYGGCQSCSKERLSKIISKSLVGIQGSTLGGGFNVAKQGAVTCENSLLVRGGANFQSGVTLGQTLTVTGITTFLAVPQCSISPTATNQLTNKNYVDETIQQNINTTLEGVIKFASMTEAEYKALEVKSPSTIYYLTDVPLWVIGDQEIVTSNMPA